MSNCILLENLFFSLSTPTPNATEDGLPYLAPWNRANPTYIKFGEEVTIENDFKKTYNTALDDYLGPPTTTTKPPTRTLHPT